MSSIEQFKYKGYLITHVIRGGWYRIYNAEGKYVTAKQTLRAANDAVDVLVNWKESDTCAYAG